MFVDLSPAQSVVAPGESWPCTVTASGAIALVSGGTAVSSETIQLGQASPRTVLLPAVLESAGPGVLTATLSNGPTMQQFVDVVPIGDSGSARSS